MEGAWRGRGLALLLLAGVCLANASGCGDDGGAEEPAPKPVVGGIVTNSPAHTFAPVVYMHPEERYLPMSGKDFVLKSVLWFGEDLECESHKVAVGQRELPRMTEPPTYSVRPFEDIDCRERSKRTYGSEEVTRPHENTPARVSGLRPEEGFYLDLDDAERGGSAAGDFGGRASLNGAAAWYEQYPERVEGQPGRRVSWWMVLGMHAPRSVDGQPLPMLTHEGDWERVDLLLQGDGKRWKPVAVRLFDPRGGGGARDGRTREIRWDELRHERAAFAPPDEDDRTHPVLFAARGTHTLYPSPGSRVRREVDLIGRPFPIRDTTGDRCRRCPRMEFEAPGFSLESQYWYGFGGAWGERGRTTLMTGPLGPRPPGS